MQVLLNTAASTAYNAFKESQKQQLVTSDISSGHTTTVTAIESLNRSKSYEKIQVRLVIVCGIII